jgi:hypothetical protein
MTEWTPGRLWRRHYALPSEHGAWIWLLGPYLIGLAAGDVRDPLALVLLIAALAAFLTRQPTSIAVKVFSGRRPRRELGPAIVWGLFYGLIALGGVAVLVSAGYGQLLWLAAPGLPVFAWHLWLVGRRKERGQAGVEIVGAGVLALSAPAAYWVAGGEQQVLAWILWGLSWFQAAASIVYVHLRLEQRRLEAQPDRSERWRMGARTLAYHIFNLLACLALAVAGWVPWLAPVAFFLMLFDALDGVIHPAVGASPRDIGLRQLAASTLFVLLLSVGMFFFPSG